MMTVASPPADVGILSFGAYVPRRRLQRGAIYAANSWCAPGLRGLAKCERAVGDWDKDSITMAVEAGRDALEAAFGRKAPHLCLAADMRKTCPASEPELTSGDAAAGLLLGFGQGVDLILLETTEAITRLAPRMGVAGSLALGEKDENYMRGLVHRGLVDIDKGALGHNLGGMPSQNVSAIAKVGLADA